MRSARLHAMCEMNHEYISDCEAGMLPETYSVRAVGVVSELQGVYSAVSRMKRFKMSSISNKSVKGSDNPDESIAASNASGYPPAVFCLLGNIPNPLFTCFARLRIRRKGDVFCKLHESEAQPFLKKMIGGDWGRPTSKSMCG